MEKRIKNQLNIMSPFLYLQEL